MPTIREAARAFEGFVADAHRAAGAVEAERLAVAGERARLLGRVVSRFSATLRRTVPDVGALADLDAAHGLGLDPGSVHSRIDAARDAAAVALADVEHRLSEADAARDAMERAAYALKGELDGARAASAAAEAGVRDFDEGFLAVRAVLAPDGGPEMPDAEAREPGLWARLTDARARRAAALVEGYRDPAGRDYFAVRDGTFLPLARTRDQLARDAAEAEERLLEARDGLARRADAVARGRVALAKARDRLAAAEAEAGDPMAVVAASAAAWLAAHAGAFEAQATLRDPRAADALDRLRSAGLLDGADLATLGHRLALGQAEAGLAERRDALRGLERKLGEGLAKLRKGVSRGAGSSYVNIDISGMDAAVRGSLAGVDAAIRSAEGRRSPRSADAVAARGADAEIPGGEALAWWLAAMSFQGSAADASDAALAAAEASGTQDPMVAAGLDRALARDLPALGPDAIPAIEVPTIHVPEVTVPTFDIPAVEVPSFSVPDAPAQYDYGSP